MNKAPDAFRTISEVAEELDLPQHVLRFWESRFPQIRPVKRAGGRRYYRPSDVALLAGIRRLLHEDGLTIRGVQKILREQGVRHVAGLAEGPTLVLAEDDGRPPVEVPDLPDAWPEPPEDTPDLPDELPEDTPPELPDLPGEMPEDMPDDLPDDDPGEDAQGIAAAAGAAVEAALADVVRAEVAAAVAEARAPEPAFRPPMPDLPLFAPLTAALAQAADTAPPPEGEAEEVPLASRLRALPRIRLRDRAERLAPLVARLSRLRDGLADRGRAPRR